jgi:hypothetical protein
LTDLDCTVSSSFETFTASRCVDQEVNMLEVFCRIAAEIAGGRGEGEGEGEGVASEVLYWQQVQTVPDRCCQ